MSLKDALTEHANILRTKTGLDTTLSIADMTRLLDDLSWRQTNLLKGTSNQYKELKGWGWLGTSTSSNPQLPIPLGETITYAATIKNTFGDVLDLQLWELDSNQNRLNYLGRSDVVQPGEEKKVSLTATVASKECKYIGLGIWSNNKVTQPPSLYVKDERLYTGTAPGFWTPNPADKVGGVADLTLAALPLRGMEVAA